MKKKASFGNQDKRFFVYSKLTPTVGKGKRETFYESIEDL